LNNRRHALEDLAFHRHLVDQYARFEPSLLADPYPLFSWLRSEEPVCWSDTLECWLITRYDDVAAALRDLRFSSSRIDALVNQLPASTREQVEPLRQHLSKFMGISDPPDHTRIRALVNKAFSPRVVDAMRARIQQIADELIDAVEYAGQMDIIRDFAYRLPVAVITEILGLPDGEESQFKKWSDDIVGFIGSGRGLEDRAHRAQDSMRQMTAYYRGIIADRRKHAREDLISTLIAAEEQGDKLTEDELLATCVTLLAGGHETTTHLIGGGMLALVRHPSELEIVRDDPSAIVPAVEELLRFESPVQRGERVAKVDVELRGRRIRKGQRVFLMMGAANRDPSQFVQPDKLNLRRQPNRHLAFGSGIHFCVGAQLARAEGQIAIRTLARRLQNPKVIAQRLVYQETLAIRGLHALPISFDAAR
jgi:cytochrome P450